MLPVGHARTGLLSRWGRSTYHWSEVRLPHDQDRWPIPSFQGVSLSDGFGQPPRSDSLLVRLEPGRRVGLFVVLVDQKPLQLGEGGG